jgi:hypothetical protein
VDPLLEEIPVTSSGEQVDPKVLDLAMKIAEKMFLKMKEEDTKKREEEESRRKAEEDKGKGNIEYNDDLVELLVSKVMSKVSLNTEGSSTKSKGNKFSKFNLITLEILSPTSLPPHLESYQLLVS